MAQTDLNVWEVVKEQIQVNRKSRINWKDVFGETLTKVVASHRAQGLNALFTLAALCGKYPGMSEELKRRLKIGVCARFGEMKSEENAHIKVKGKCPTCGR